MKKRQPILDRTDSAEPVLRVRHAIRVFCDVIPTELYPWRQAIGHGIFPEQVSTHTVF